VSTLTDTDRSALLRLARSTIESELDKEKIVQRPEAASGTLAENRGCFVTLHKSGALRGCIGTIEPEAPLVDGVEENAINAAFRDPRFPALTKEELPEIEIEVSVLTLPRVLEFSNEKDLRTKLKPGIHGVILSRGWQRSTFLPQVWKQLPDMAEFLGNLCNKASMEWRCWLDKKTTMKVYEAEYFSENGF
jgi:AmmeMemoRadiSam system protein A